MKLNEGQRYRLTTGSGGTYPGTAYLGAPCTFERFDGANYRFTRHDVAQYIWVPAEDIRSGACMVTEADGR